MPSHPHRSPAVRPCLRVAAGLVAAMLAPASLPAALPMALPASLPDVPARIAANDNRVAAGTLRGGVLTVRLEARVGRWHPEAEDGPGLDVQAFGETGQATTIPGPLIRVRAGTMIHAIVRNTLDSTLVLYGLHARPGHADDTIQVAPGAEREVRFSAGAPGTYYYWGSTSGLGIDALREADSQLSGALVVDPATATEAERADRVFVMGIWFRPDPEQFVMVVNGRSWPHTERLSFTVGDTVRWRWINASESAHPMHLHGFYFDVASRGAWAADTAHAPDAVRRVVTELMPPGGTMTLRWVPERAGNWIFHCHFGFHVSHFLELPGAQAAGTAAVEPEVDTTHAAHAAHAANGATPPPATAHRMAGLVLGLHVRPRPGAAPVTRVEPARHIRLLAQQRARAWGDSAGMSFVPHERGPEPASDSITPVSETLVLRRGEPVAITIVNRLDEPTIVHWHGIELESFPDGVPNWSGDSARTLRHVAPGDSFTVQFTPPRTGTFIYHSHSNETRQISSGLYGALLVVEPGVERDTASERLIVVGAAGPDLTAPGVVNGAFEPPPMTLELGRTYRLRLVNLNMDWRVAYRLGTDTTVARWTALAKDGADLPPSQATERPAYLLTGPGETADFAFTPMRAGELRLDVATQLSGWHVPVRVLVRVPARARP